jgi:hypothetical protein
LPWSSLRRNRIASHAREVEHDLLPGWRTATSGVLALWRSHLTWPASAMVKARVPPAPGVVKAKRRPHWTASADASAPSSLATAVGPLLVGGWLLLRGCLIADRVRTGVGNASNPAQDRKGHQRRTDDLFHDQSPFCYERSSTLAVTDRSRRICKKRSSRILDHGCLLGG